MNRLAAASHYWRHKVYRESVPVSLVRFELATTFEAGFSVFKDFIRMAFFQFRVGLEDNFSNFRVNKGSAKHASNTAVTDEVISLRRQLNAVF